MIKLTAFNLNYAKIRGWRFPFLHYPKVHDTISEVYLLSLPQSGRQLAHLLAFHSVSDLKTPSRKIFQSVFLVEIDRLPLVAWYSGILEYWGIYMSRFRNSGFWWIKEWLKTRGSLHEYTSVCSQIWTGAYIAQICRNFWLDFPNPLPASLLSKYNEASIGRRNCFEVGTKPLQIVECQVMLERIPLTPSLLPK